MEKEGPEIDKRLPNSQAVQDREEPLRGLIHGLPGTGKSRVLNWLRRLLVEGMQWEHGTEFVFVAFQNKVAHAMGGVTLHSCAELTVGAGKASRTLQHTDVDTLFTRNQHLRWIIMDEVFMIPDDLLGNFAGKFQEAVRGTRFKKRKDKSLRPFGGIIEY